MAFLPLKKVPGHILKTKVKVSCVPAPYWLNGWKHHMGFICSELKAISGGDDKALHSFCSNLKIMGASVSDLYTGGLSPENIAAQVGNQLKGLGTFEYQSYYDWIQESPGGFREITISDSSVWTLLQGKCSYFYLHLHPSRYSEQTIRVKANILKSAVALLACEHMNLGSTHPLQDADKINFLRKEFLGLSPVNIRIKSGIGSLADKLREFSLNRGYQPFR